MYCHNFHLVLSDADFSFVDHLCHVYRVISHMMNMCPNLISLFHRIFFYVVGDVCWYSAVSRWVACFLVASPLWHVVIGSLVDCSFFSIFLFGLENTLHRLCIMMRLFTLDGCGDYRQVWCVAFFSMTSILVVSSGPHQWIQLVDRTSMYLAQLAFCSDCREVTRQRFLSMFSHNWP